MKPGWPISLFHDLPEETNQEPEKPYGKIQQGDPAGRDGVYPPFVATKRRGNRNHGPGIAKRALSASGEVNVIGMTFVVVTFVFAALYVLYREREKRRAAAALG